MWVNFFFRPYLNRRWHCSDGPHSSPLWEGKDWMTAVYFAQAHIRRALRLCWSGGRLITPVWGLVEDIIGGLHSCQELFTPSSFSPNGTSESIKTIITAIPESKEIILGCQRKHGKVVWSYLVRNLLDVHLARQPITASIFCGGVFSGADTLLIAAEPLSTSHCWRMQMVHFDLSWWAPVGKQKSMSVLDEVQTLSTTMFSLPP